jgi:hypothetical protein
MTEATKRQLAEASDAVGAARDAIARSVSTQARRDNYEDLDFWLGKMAGLQALAREEGGSA